MLSRRIIFLISFGILAGCAEPVKTEDVRVVRMVTVLGRIMNPLGEALQKVLPKHFPARIEVQRIAAGSDTARLLEEGQAELSMISTDVAYLAYTKGIGDPPRPHRKLRGVAVLYAVPVHLIASEASRIQGLDHLRGKRVSLGAKGSRTEYVARMTLEGVGISLNNFDARWLSEVEAKTELRERKLDAVLMTGNDPSPNVVEIMQIPGLRLIPIIRPEMEAIRSRHPYVHSVTIPAGIYGDHPDIESIGIDSLLACREDLPEELVYWITRTLFESLPDLARSLTSLRQVDLAQIHATPIPLHPGAARFYRERELFQ